LRVEQKKDKPLILRLISGGIYFKTHNFETVSNTFCIEIEKL